MRWQLATFIFSEENVHLNTSLNPNRSDVSTQLAAVNKSAARGNLRIPQDFTRLIGENSSSPTQRSPHHFSLLSAWDRLSNRRSRNFKAKHQKIVRSSGQLLSGPSTGARVSESPVGRCQLSPCSQSLIVSHDKHDVRSDYRRCRLLLPAVNILCPDSTELTFRNSSSACQRPFAAQSRRE
jgi:hypothetical protein